MQLRTLTPGLGLAMTIAASGAFFTALPAAAADGFTLKDKPKIAMLYFGPKNDGGWTQAFDEARVKIEKEIGQKIQFVENVPEDASAIKPAAEKFIQRGANIVIGTAFGYSDTFKELAAKYPRGGLPQRLGHHQRRPTSNRSTAAPTKASTCAAWPPAPHRRRASSASSRPTRSAW